MAAKSDLGVRTLSAIVMLAVAGGALWLEGLWFSALIALVAVAAFAEFVLLVLKATGVGSSRLMAVVAGAFYIGLAASALIGSPGLAVLIVGAVVFVDVFAYFFGRTIGGPKIAPRISPSKTWAGLMGGAIGAATFLVAFFQLWPAVLCRPYYRLVDGQPVGSFGFDHRCDYVAWGLSIGTIVQVMAVGLAVAVIAQSGDFLESWLKRKAGVKDSSNLIPGHGGVLDRTDGVIAVAFVAGLLSMVTT